MHNFVFDNPTRVHFGEDAESGAGAEVRACGGSKVLLHYGSSHAERSGLLRRVRQSLDAAGVAHVCLGGVVPNPRLGLVREGIALCEREKVDFLLAVGGGSVIDSAKAIAVGVADKEHDVWDYFLHVAHPKASLPVGAILTIAAAGSETSVSAVVTNEANHLKRAIDLDLIRPKFALLNPALLATLPPFQVSCGIVDIMMHTLERYFSPTRGNELTDDLAEALLRNVIRNAAAARGSPPGLAALSELMWAGSLSHNGLTGLGADGDWATHAMSLELSGFFDVAHGASLSALWGSWARYVLPADPWRFAQYARNVWGCSMSGSAELTALAGIESTERFFRSLDMPISIPQLGVGILTEAQIRELSRIRSDNGRATAGSFKVLHERDIHAIYSMANR
jgi:hypothetical protein